MIKMRGDHRVRIPVSMDDGTIQNFALFAAAQHARGAAKGGSAFTRKVNVGRGQALGSETFKCASSAVPMGGAKVAWVDPRTLSMGERERLSVAKAT